MGTHTLTFSPNNNNLVRLTENLEVGGVLRMNSARSPSAVEQAEEAKARGQGGKYRQSFRPIMWIWGPNEEAPIWQSGFDAIFKLASSVLDFSCEKTELVGVGIGDHKPSTMRVFKDNFPESLWLQCFTHLIRNARSRKGKFVGTSEEKERQVSWFVDQVKYIIKLH
jgi:hypothetical protein